MCENARRGRHLPIQLYPDALLSSNRRRPTCDRAAGVRGEELVGKRIDARAMSVEVDLETRGCGLIRGARRWDRVQQEEIAMALARHATSKTASRIDPERVATLGFRR